MSSIVNKIKDAMHQPHHSDPEGTHGPHQSRPANAADPRVDSDRDNRAQHAAGPTGGQYTTNDNYTTGGPHQSNMMNKADPRVDSDRDGRQAMGGTGSGMPAANLSAGHNANPTGHQPMGGTGSGIPATDRAAGPHHSAAANKADPRIDSDRDGSRNMGMNQNQGNYAPGVTAPVSGPNTHSQTQGYPRSQPEGPYGHGTHGTQGVVGGAHGPGPAPHTAGPHKQDMLNKLDPRVDSNLDGSRTVGKDKTFAQQ